MKYIHIIILLIAVLYLPCNAERRTSGTNASNSTNIISGIGEGSVEGRTIPSEPIGWLSVQSNMVRVGNMPMLTWNITHPSIVEDYVTICPPSTIRVNYDIQCNILILGTGVTTVDRNKKLVYMPTEAQVNYNDRGYNQIFFGINRNIPRTIVWSKTMHKNDTLSFGGRYRYNNNWSSGYNSSDGSRNIRSMVAGDTPPSIIPSHNAPSLESFLRPYLNASGKVDIGPMDVIVFMELTHGPMEISNSGYDLQDMVLLVTFEPIIATRK